MKLKNIVSLITAVSFLIPVKAQMEAKEKVEIKLNRFDIANAVYHFDIPFNLVGPVPAGTRKIIFSYKVSDDEKVKSVLKKGKKFPGWISLPVKDPDGSYVQSSEWINGGSDQNFSLHCKGMHPNLKYDFQFEIIKDPVADDKLRVAIKKKLSEAILDFYETAVLNSLDSGDLVTLNTNLEAILKTELRIGCDELTELRQKCDDQQTYTVDVSSDGMVKTAFEKLSGLLQNKFNALETLFGDTKQVEQIVSTIRSYQQPLIDTIEILLSDKTALTKFSKALLDQPFSPSLESFKAYSLRDGLTILRKIALVPEHLEAIFKGEEKIFNKDFVNTDKLDVGSLQFLRRLLALLSEKTMQYVDNGKLITAFYVYPEEDIRSVYEEILMLFIEGYNAAAILDDALQDLESGKLFFPDLVADIVLSQSFISDVVSVADVTSSKTPYISAEGGIGYSTSFQNAFSYYGANFYLSPVNKKARLKTFRGWNLIKKVVCFNLGISNFFGKRPADSYSILGDDSPSDLLIGIGFRTGRIVKINFDWLPYKTNNDNPLGNKKIIKGDFVVSIGADVNLLSAFSTVAKALRLIQ